MLQAVPEYYFAGYSHAASAATAACASAAVDTTQVFVVLRMYNNTDDTGAGVLYLLPSYPRNTSLPNCEVPHVTLPLPSTPKPPPVQSNTVDVNEDIEIHYVSSSQASDWDWSDDEVIEKEEGNDVEKNKAEDYPTHGTLLELRDDAEATSDTHALPARSKDTAHFLICAATSSTPESVTGCEVPVLHPHTRLAVLGYEQTGPHAVYVLATFPKVSSSLSVSSSTTTASGVMIYRCVDLAVLSGMCDRVETSTLRRLPVHVPSATNNNSNNGDRVQRNDKGESEVVYSPPLDTSLLTKNYGIDATGASLSYRLSGAQHTERIVHFVGVACGIPWVCEVDDSVTNNNNTDVATQQYCEPLPLCYDKASLMRLYAPQALTTTTTTTTNILPVNEHPSTINNERPALPITMVNAHRVKIAGPYGVPLQCDTRTLDRFALHHGDRLRALTANIYKDSTKEGTGRLATVIGVCGGCLVILYDGDTRATLLPSEVNSEAALRQHFVPLTERGVKVEVEESKFKEADDEAKKEVEEEEVEHATTTNPSTPFTNFLTAYGLHMSRHTQSNAHATSSSVSKDAWRVAQAYFMTDTVQRMSAALRVYHKVQVEMEQEGCEQQLKPLLSWEDYGRLVAKHVNVA